MLPSRQTGAIAPPTSLTVRMKSRLLELGFNDPDVGAVVYGLPFELLRVYSPSAEVKGHGAGQEILQTGKRNVSVTAVEPVGNYAIQPHFDDGHNTGLFTWEYLYWLGKNQAQLWDDYLGRLEAAGFTRESGRDASMMASGSGADESCGHKH